MKRALKRGIVLTLAIVAILVTIAALVVFHYAQPQQIARLLVDFSRSELHLDLRFAGEPRYAFWPRLSLNLDQLRLCAQGQPEILLSARQLRVTLPWSSLRSSRLQIDALELDGPDVDLQLVQEWNAQAADAAPLPDAHARLRVVDGILRRGSTRLAGGIAIDGEVGLREIDAWWHGLGNGEDARTWLPPVRGSARATDATLGALRLQGIQIDSESP